MSVGVYAGVRGEEDDALSGIDTGSGGSRRARFAEQTSENKFSASAIDFRFRLVLVGGTAPSWASVTVSRSGLRFFGLCDRFP